MVERLKIEGNSPEEKFASIEAALQSLRRRISGRNVVYIPPIPLLLMSGGDPNIIGRIIFPFSGKLKDLFVNVEALTTRTVVLGVDIITDVAKTHMNFTLSKRSQRFEMEMLVDAGTIFQVIVEEGSLLDPMIATAIYPVIEDHKAKQFLLEELERENGE